MSVDAGPPATPAGADVWSGAVADVHDPQPVLESQVTFHGKVWDVRRETVDLGAGGHAVRDFILHPGAVAVLALDPEDRVLLVRQYRHPVGSYLLEIPAGLRDVAGEPLVETGRRELLEETGYVADRWDTLVDVLLSPGASAERIRILLARDVHPHPDGRPGDRHGEEVDLPIVWTPLADLVAGVFAGRLRNSTAVVGVLAAHTARAGGWSGLRPADAPEA